AHREKYVESRQVWAAVDTMAAHTAHRQNTKVLRHLSLLGSFPYLFFRCDTVTTLHAFAKLAAIVNAALYLGNKWLPQPIDWTALFTNEVALLRVAQKGQSNRTASRNDCNAAMKLIQLVIVYLGLLQQGTSHRYRKVYLRQLAIG